MIGNGRAKHRLQRFLDLRSALAGSRSPSGPWKMRSGGSDPPDDSSTRRSAAS